MLHLLIKPLVLRAILLMLLVGTVVVMTLTPGLRPPDLMARHLERQLDSLPDSLVAQQVQQIAELDESGTGVLVRALGNRRKVVLMSAGSALHAQLDRWALLSARESSPRVARLAQVLSQHVDHWGSAPRSIAADLAVRILQWPLHTKTVAKGSLIAHCEHVVRAAAGHSQEPLTAAENVEIAADRAEPSLHKVADRRDPRGVLELPLSGVPGGDLPIDEVPIPPLPPAVANPLQPRGATGDEPRLIPPSARTLPRVLGPDERDAEESGGLPPSPLGWAPDPDAQGADRNAPISASMRTAEPKLNQLSDLELIYRLQSASGSELKAVEQQLQYRGVDKSQLDLARRLSDPNPTVRRQLAESLSSLNTSPSPWLFWLSYDSDPLVRKLVVSLMATSQDPRLHRRLREMQSLETDEEVRGQLDQLQENRPGR